MFVACATPPAPDLNAAGLYELSRAIRGVSDYLNDSLPAGSAVVFVNAQSGSAELSGFIIDDLIANAVSDGNFTATDRPRLEALLASQRLQLSGEVDDEAALGVGRFFHAQTVVIGRVSALGENLRLTVRALDVPTGRGIGQHNRSIGTTRAIAALAGSCGGQCTGIFAGGWHYEVEPPAGVIVPGGSLTEKLDWLQESAQSHGVYIVEVRADEDIAPHVLEYSGRINVTVILRGDDANRTVRLASNGTLLTVRPNVTLVLDNNITLQGHAQNTAPLLRVGGGIVRMNAGSVIIGNTNNRWPYGGGVFVSGIFDMNGGTIHGNSSPEGGGVLVAGGNFTMAGGAVSGNTANYGGGVYVRSGHFTMSSGTVAGNAADRGGGVFSMSNFIMNGGTVIGNVARDNGGGVIIWGLSTFFKRGGTITGYASDPNAGNVVRDDAGNALDRSGHAIFVAGSARRRETTTGAGVSLSLEGMSASGDWEN